MRPTDPKALKRKTRPSDDRKKTGAVARRATKAVVLEPVLASDTRMVKGRERGAAPPSVRRVDPGGIQALATSGPRRPNLESTTQELKKRPSSASIATASP